MSMCRRRQAARSRKFSTFAHRAHTATYNLSWTIAPHFLDHARNSDWIAGHVPRDDMANGLIWLDRPVEYFSSVREPVSQLISHLNWSFERYSRSNYYDLHDRTNNSSMPR